MADAASRAERAAAMEEKRKRIQEMKQRRENRATSAKTAGPAASGNLDDYIDGLLAEQPAAEETAAIEKPANETSNGGHPAPKQDTDTPSTTQETTTPAPAPPPAPKVETFTISTQTISGEFPESEEIIEGDNNAPESAKVPETTTSTIHNEAEREKEKEEPKPLSTDEMAKTLSSKPFSSFINTASKKVERILGSPLLSDLLEDYTAPSSAKDDANNKSSNSTTNKCVQSQQAYECKRWTVGRDVTDIDWSTHHREWMLATYHTSSSNKTSAAPAPSSSALSSSLTPGAGELQSDGLALIWSLAMPHRPEHVFTAGSPVTCGRHHATDPMLVVGGCESGQIVVWDVRAGRLPVQKSALVAGASASNKGHVYPIGAMEVIEGGAGLVTASSDGRLNFWSLASLREPAESMQVGHSISSLAVSPESESLLVGDEQGFLHAVSSSSSPTGQRSGRRQAKKLATVDDEGENHGHYGLITSLATKTVKASRGATATGISKGFLRGTPGLVLSTGVDWTVKLWAPAYSDRPLFSLVSHSYDYMSDVMWSPTHPSLFATASSNGTVGLWNLASSFDEPVSGSEGIVVVDGQGLNKISWSLDGRRLAVACADQVHVLGLSDDVLRAKGDEDSKVMNQLLTRGWIERP